MFICLYDWRLQSAEAADNTIRIRSYELNVIILNELAFDSLLLDFIMTKVDIK